MSSSLFGRPSSPAGEARLDVYTKRLYEMDTLGLDDESSSDCVAEMAGASEKEEITCWNYSFPALSLLPVVLADVCSPFEMWLVAGVDRS